MTSADRLRGSLGRLGLTQRGLARALGLPARQVRGWCAGREEPPAAVWLALEALEARGLRVEVPAGVGFGDLGLSRDPSTGAVTFSWAPLERLCAASGLDREWLRASEDRISALIVAWYAAHRAQGGEPDATAEDLLAEIRAEDARGGGLSHQPGRA